MLAVEVLGLSPTIALVCVAIVLLGASLQASIGVGLGLLAAPTLSLVDPAFVPGALTVCVVPLTVGMTLRERHHIDRDGISRAVVGRFVGVVIGAWAVANMDETGIAVVVAASVLLAVVGSLTGLRFTPTPRNLLAAGTASGFSGTVAGVGGPPMALTYQHSDPRTLRATLALFNMIGSAFTIPSLVIAGVIGRRELALALMLVPGVLIGLRVGRFTIARLPPERVRPYVLVACAASAVVLLARQVF
ncbi:MAG TPA: sulfite exporter TauE/SafE family protein [Ilumatobacter sp.]